jgi:hypothetical protein
VSACKLQDHSNAHTVLDPNYEASQQQVKESRDAYEFNAAQRAHAHLLENMSQTVLSMLVAGLLYPRASAALGAGWLISRILFCYGYGESDGLVSVLEMPDLLSSHPSQTHLTSMGLTLT